jgi:predicted nucleotidyltransferase
MATIDEIEQFGRRIGEEFGAEKVILFGSRARGNAGPDSDVDILVIMSLEARGVDTSIEMRMRLRPRFPVDILVRTPEKVRERIEMGDTFIRGILEQGKVLYEADNDEPEKQFRGHGITVDPAVIDAIKRYLAALPSFGIHASKAVLYGSFAMGRADQDSDIDLVVIAPEFDGRRDIDMVKDLWHATLHADIRIEPIPCGEKEWDSGDGRPILEIARREGVVIEAGRP